MFYEDVSFVLGSKLCKAILEQLNSSKEPMTPFQLSKNTDIARSNISTKLGLLSKRGLVRCINPDVRKWRFYEITKKGREVLEKA